MSDSTTDLAELKALMARLRAPDGCPWDREQTFQTIWPYTLEEAYEVADAIESKNWSNLEEELGDLLFQVLYHAQMAAEASYFTLDSVIAKLSEKIKERHPHVFEKNNELKTSVEVSDSWAQHKRQKQLAQTPQASVLENVPKKLPALQRAEKLQAKARSVGFDWPNIRGALDKFSEEQAELLEAMDEGDTQAITDEMGDVFFSLVNVCRFLKVSPEVALRGANQKFEKRFRQMETHCVDKGLHFEQLSLVEMEALWQQAKENESC